jgi:hypothetical protein
MEEVPRRRRSVLEGPDPGMATRRRRHQIAQRRVRIVLCFDQDDWLAWCDANGYEIVPSAGFTIRPDSLAVRDEDRALRVVDHIDATCAVGDELLETDRFADRGDADTLRSWTQRQLRPRLV